MRRHDARKWLHAILDLLPVILIPVFMIYSHRHDVAQDFEVVTQEPNYYETNEVTSASDIVVGNIYYYTNSFTSDYNGNSLDLFSLDVNLFKDQFPTFVNDTITRVNMYLRSDGRLFLYVVANETNTVNIDSTAFNFIPIQIYNTNLIENYMIDYIESSNYQYVKSYQDVVTTIPKDVMSSFVDRFNNTVNTYFNMGNVFGLNGVYEWFNTNVFGGNAPTIIYSVWNIALYELLMDLLMLLYALFMWFIDFCQDLIDRCFTTSKGGKH